MPPQLHIALAQSVGNAARPTVAVGQRVRKGETLAEPDGRLSAAVHAPTSGTITAIGPHPFAHPSGLPVDTVTLQPDGLDEWQPRQPLDWQQADGAEHVAAELQPPLAEEWNRADVGLFEADDSPARLEPGELGRSDLATRLAFDERVEGEDPHRQILDRPA